MSAGRRTSAPGLILRRRRAEKQCVRRPLDRHPLFTEIQIGRLVGWPLLAVTVASGVGCGLLAIMTDGPQLLGHAPEALLIPAVIPLCFEILRGRSLPAGLVGGLFAATLALLVVGLYGLWQVACFIITFMGEC